LMRENSSMDRSRCDVAWVSKKTCSSAANGLQQPSGTTETRIAGGKRIIVAKRTTPGKD